MAPGTKRVLKIVVAAVVLVHVAIGIALAGVRYGWWVEKLEPAEISALLRPNDAVFVPEGTGKIEREGIAQTGDADRVGQHDVFGSDPLEVG